MTSKILKTQNEEWGFWGTTLNNYNEKKTQKRWNEAFEILLTLSGKSSEEIREYLDSRSGRHLANSCNEGKDVQKTILENYYKWIDKDLFEEEDKKDYKIEKNRMLFGTKVKNEITGSEDILLYTYENPRRINKKYSVCIDKFENKYTIGMNYISPIEE